MKLDANKSKIGIFVTLLLLGAVYVFSVIEHEDGLGKVCLILLVCLGVTIPVVVLNFNELDVRFSVRFYI
jgi:hypothetical protein